MEINAFIYLEFVRNIMRNLPGTSEGLCFGKPAFYIKKKPLARMWENGEVIVVHNPERELWMKKDPETFFISDHYRNYPSMLINLERVQPDDLKELLVTAWLGKASKTLLKEYQVK